MGKNILLAWPRADKGFYDFSPLRIIAGLKGQFTPLPLLTVAAALGPGFNYKLVDEEIEPLTENHVSWSDYILISANILQKKSAERIINFVRPFNKPIIIGGPILSTLNNVFQGDITRVIGEIEALEKFNPEKSKSIAELLARDMIQSNLKSLYMARGHPDVSTLPPPRYDLVDLNNYLNISIQTSRGCHHSCDFCQLVPLYGPHQRKTTNQIISELNLIVGHNVGKTIYIIDDNFMGNIDHPREKSTFTSILSAIGTWQKKHNYSYDFLAQCSLEIADHTDIVKQMTAIGINILFIGIETLNKQALLSVHKKQNLVNDQIERIKTLQSFGMGIIAGFILGFDEDDSFSVEQQINFMRMSNIPVAGVTILQAPFGTKLYNKMADQKRISSDPEAITKPFRTNILLYQNPEKFYKQYLYLVKTVFLPNEYFSRCLAWIRDWNAAYVIPGRHGSISENINITRLFRSIIKQGFSSNYKFQYWKYLFFALKKFAFNKPKIALALYLVYFYEVFTEDILKIEEFVGQLPSEIIIEWHQKMLKQIIEKD